MGEEIEQASDMSIVYCYLRNSALPG